MKEILLPTGHIAIVDDEDYERVSAHKWALLNNHDRGFYARANLKVSSSPRKYVSLIMHRFIAGAKPAEVVDHINRNGLDNRKENLRIATRSTNAANSKHRSDRSTSPYRGAYKAKNRYKAQIRVNGKLVQLGSYVCPKEAALAYDYAADHYFGAFAVKNNPFKEERRALVE